MLAGQLLKAVEESYSDSFAGLVVLAIARSDPYLSLVVEAIVWADFSRTVRAQFPVVTVLDPMMLSVARTRDLCKMVLVVGAAGSGKVTPELTVVDLNLMMLLTECPCPPMTPISRSLTLAGNGADLCLALSAAVTGNVLANGPVVRLLTPADLPLLLSAALLPSQTSSVAPHPIFRGLRSILWLLSKELGWLTSGQNLINNT